MNINFILWRFSIIATTKTTKHQLTFFEERSSVSWKISSNSEAFFFHLSPLLILLSCRSFHSSTSIYFIEIFFHFLCLRAASHPLIICQQHKKSIDDRKGWNLCHLNFLIQFHFWSAPKNLQIKKGRRWMLKRRGEKNP